MGRIGSALFGSELGALNSLSRAIGQRDRASTRLSTLQGINRGSDNPAGLIAAEQLRSELVAIEAASTNAARAVSTVRVADSGLAAIGGLLNRIQSNVVASAGSISDGERNANQIEIDAALEAINRISNYANLGGRRLLDGSGGFDVSGVNSAQVANIDIYARGNGSVTELDIEVVQAATTAEVTFTDADSAIDTDVTLLVSGDQGSVTLDFSAGASLEDIAAAVNAATGETGVTATVDGTDLDFNSAEVGSDASVAVSAESGTFDLEAEAATGTDVVIDVGGQQFTGSGNSVEIRTDAVSADIVIAEGFSGTVDTITVSGDALRFAIVANLSQTATLALPNTNTSALGGAAGRLSSLGSGGSASLSSGNLQTAVEILDAARNQVQGARARAGAFERNTIESTQRVLDSAQENISAGISQIADADVARESSLLLRSQILVSAGISSLQIASSRRGELSDLLVFF